MRKFFLSFLAAISFASSSWAATHVILIRHGQTDWNKERRIQGHTDNLLNETGIAQAKMLAEKIAKNFSNIDAIYSSDLQRAYDTALATAEKLNLPVHKKTGLREVHFGKLEGVLITDPEAQAALAREAQLDKDSPDRKKLWDAPFSPGSESFNQNLDRMKQAIIEIAKDHPDQTVLVFSHGRSIKNLFLDTAGTTEPLHLGNCGMISFAIDLANTAKPIAFQKVEDPGIDNPSQK